MSAALRIAVLCGYMPFFDETMPPTYRQEKEAWCRSVAAMVEDVGEVFCAGLVTDHETGARIGRQLQAFDPDAILLAPSMASPPGYTWAAIADLPRTPIVLWNAHELDTVSPEYDMSELIRHSANVGSLMIGNVLIRSRRRPILVTGRFRDPAVQKRLRRLLRAAAVAGRLRKARFGVFGQPHDGYLNVVADDEDLREHIGPSLVRVSREEFTEAFASVPAERVDGLAAELRSRYVVEAPDEELRPSVQLVCALRDLVERYALSGGTFNCWDFSVHSPRLGVIGCLANALLTTEGIPFTCTGDIITAIAMYLAKQLGGACFYCELDTIDYQRDMVLCANTGEGDFSLAPDCRLCRVIASGAASGRRARGCSVLYPAREGQATLVGFSPNGFAPSGYALQVAPGAVLGTPELAIRVPTLWFRFRNGPTASAFERWLQAGATHHVALAWGDLTEELEAVASALGIQAIVI